jgi:Zn-dependent M28 family amino/carboxypeptidase
MSFGPRIPGTKGHDLAREWIRQELEDFGWQITPQVSYYQGKKIINLIGSREGSSGGSQIILGAHYDTRMIADRSANEEDREKPVPGANDGASGVAVLMELARVMPEFDRLDIRLVFFDAEDNGYIPGWDWILGSTHFAGQLATIPEAVVIIDMVGDATQEIYFEKSSEPILKNEIWNIAEQHNVPTFIPEEKHHILDDHTPFLGRGIPSVLIIDFDYSYWHTTEDTIDKVSEASLENVGFVILEWLKFRDKQE